MSSSSASATRAGSAAAAVRANVWLRNERRTQTWAILAIIWSLVVAGLMFRSGGLTLVGYVISGVLYLGLAALGLALAWRVARAGVWIGRDRIVVRGPFRTRSIALADAVSFAPGLQGRGGNGTPCPILERHGGATVGVWALGQRNIWFRYERLCQEIQPLCDELNRLICSMRS